MKKHLPKLLPMDISYNNLMKINGITYSLTPTVTSLLRHRDIDRCTRYHLPNENPTIGLILCKSAKKTVVELTLPKDATSTQKNRSAAQIASSAKRELPTGRVKRGNSSSTWPPRNC